MKPSLLVWSLLSLVSIPTLAAGTPNVLYKREGNQDDQAAEVADDSPKSTVFNGIEVPPQTELTPDNFKETIADGYWFVKHHSPSCPHCIKVAPTWQTLYEFYYTSNPLASSTAKSPDVNSMNSFTKFYDFHFASMNCLAFMDLCKSLDVKYFPTFALYHNGELVEQYEGPKSMEGLSKFIEEKLELIRPGSRPRNGVKLPEPGAASVDTTALPDTPEAKDKNPEAGKKAGEKHKEQAAKLDSKQNGKESASEVESPAPKKVPVEKPKKVYNPQGTSVPLTAESFQKFVTKTRDLWFVKFYVPWCSHCQKLAPTWKSMAKEMKGVINIGEVNCEVEKRLCKDAGVDAYPTLLVFKGGQKVEYSGMRGFGDLVNFAQRAAEIGSGVPYVNATRFKELEEQENVIFLYLYDFATTSEDFTALDRLTLNLVNRARLVKSDSAELAERFKVVTFPRLLVVREGRANYYNYLTPQDMRNYHQMLDWMRSVWLPIVPELTAFNAREIMDGKFVVLGILSHKRPDEMILAKRELKNAALEWMDKQTQLFHLERQELRDAKQLRIEEAEDRDDQRALRAAKNMVISIREEDRKQVRFAWVDGDFWDRWLRTTYGIDVKEGERVIINDEENRRYWDSTSSGARIMPSRTSILETIPLVISNPPKLRSKSTVGFIESIYYSSRTFVSDHPIISLIILAFVVAAAFVIGRRRNLRRGGPSPWGILGYGNGGGFFRLDGKEGILSAGSTGKVD